MIIKAISVSSNAFKLKAPATGTNRSPSYLMGAYAQRLPDIWYSIEGLLEQRFDPDSGVGFLPPWCLLPREAYYQLFSSDEAAKAWSISSKNVGALSSTSPALVAWNYTRFVYKFDPTLYEEITKTIIKGKIPCEILLKLPTYAVYIQVPKACTQNLNGVFACLSPFVSMDTGENDDSRFILSLVVDADSYTVPYELVLDKKNGSLLDAVNYYDDKFDDEDEMLEYYVQMSRVIQCLLYICSSECDVDQEIKQSFSVPTKYIKKNGTFRMFAPKRSRVINVGKNIGKQIRAYTAANSASSDGVVRPHIRKAHWHGFWAGPRKGERSYDLKWLPPIPVGAKNNYKE